MTAIQKSKLIQILRLVIDLEARLDDYIKHYDDGEFDVFKPIIDKVLVRLFEETFN
jgi:hypothetical protein